VKLRCLICKAEVAVPDASDHLNTHTKEELAEVARTHSMFWERPDRLQERTRL
jgi:hypothetical protein